MNANKLSLLEWFSIKSEQTFAAMFSFEIFHDQEVGAVLMADVIQCANMRMIRLEMAFASCSKRCRKGASLERCEGRS